jgi:hypothetical protein
MAVYDSRRTWWYDWRSVDAFLGYGENETARRSAHSTEVYYYGIVILNDTATRRHTEGTLWRVGASFVRLVSGDYYILRYL